MAVDLRSKISSHNGAVDSIHPAGSDHGDAATAADSKSAIQQPDTRAGGWLQWHEPGTSPEEKKLIFKLDWFLLSISCLLFFIKQVSLLLSSHIHALTLGQLDQNNISNAYVSGMSEELGFGPGNELSWMNTYFSIGTIIGGLFSNLVITVIRPRYWLPGCLLTWSLFVSSCTSATTPTSSTSCASSSGSGSLPPGRASCTSWAHGTARASSLAGPASSSSAASSARCSPAICSRPCTPVCTAREGFLPGGGCSSLTLSWPSRSLSTAL